MSLSPHRLKRRSLSEEVADRLRDMILAGELRPEQRVTQDELAGGLGVSTMPVREGLLRLAHEGLVEASPNRSFRIVRNTREDLRDIYWAHATLAAELTARACRLQLREPSFPGRLRSDEAALRSAVQAGDTSAMEAANWSFHRRINRAARAPRLMQMLRTTLRPIPQHFYTLVEGWAPISREGHDAIISAFERGDPEAARHAAFGHVRDAGELMIAHFSDAGYWTPPRQP